MSTSILVARAIGIGGAFWLSGNIAALSFISVPALNLAKGDGAANAGSLTRLWRYNYELGKAQNPPIAALTAASLSFLAWSSRAAPMPLYLYGAAAALTVGIVPYTIATMRITNNKLIKKSEEIGRQGLSAQVSVDEEMEVQELLKRWTWLNGIRSILPALGGIAAFLAATI
ncbi:Anthrone oxygenase encC [Lasiodiplodia hormozganensis]|uniref:Anthrone oxygenase encC n=1 Tax=Lasiodiplodia hormozganensis TaxID=869390 RepID=A0AA39XQG0_9PEZI|nr:Anthrone oxygenase encC [Lasiodiplodia hormozganensis]